MAKPSRELDPAMVKVLDHFERSGKTLDKLGVDLGYGADVARKAAWQFLRKTTDPHISICAGSQPRWGSRLRSWSGKSKRASDLPKIDT